MAIGSATPLISNMPSGAAPDASSRPDATRFVEVPMSVTMPPRIAANEIGMRYHEPDGRAAAPRSRPAGRACATIGVLLRIDDAAAVGTAARAT
ncbi:MAG: hypothetical protein U5R14_10680 [Gemmatimonadota bacterium]|nr:hypothetical protein [Gemmatimonadota bacterium]